MYKNVTEDRGKIRHLSEYVDSLLKKVIRAGMHDPNLENEIKELNDMLKALDYPVQSRGSEMDKD